MREFRAGRTLLVALMCAVALAACKEPTKPIKKLNIKRASDLEPITVTNTSSVEEAEAQPVVPAVAPSEEIEIVEAQGFRGQCDTQFAGINADDLLAVRNANNVRTVRLAGISIPDAMRTEAHNQIRIWLDKRSVGLEVDNSVPAIDPAVYVFLCPDGILINEELVRAGLAIPAEGSFQRAESLKKASVEALTAGRGVWGKKN